MFYSDGVWVARDPESGIGTPTPPWLHLSIHDSDFAAIRYAPKEAQGLVAWAREVQHGLIPDMQAVRQLLADDGADEPDWDDPDLTDDEIFVEGKCRRARAS